MNVLKMLIATYALLVFTSQANAQWRFQPRVMLGATDYQLQVDSGSSNVIGSRILASETFGDSNSEAGSISDTFVFAGFGLSLLYETYFIDLYVQEALSGSFADADSFTINNQAQLPSNVENSTLIQDGELDRTDFAFSVGKSFTNGFAVSLGYKSGSTQFSQDSIFGGQPFTSNYEFETGGAFVGLSYGHQFAAGLLGLNLAIADLQAEYFFKNNFLQLDSSTIPPLNGSIAGSATGTTIGVTWKAPIPYADIEGLNYLISLDFYDYSIDLRGDSVGLNPQNTDIFSTRIGAPLQSNFSESVSNLRFAIQYLF